MLSGVEGCSSAASVWRPLLGAGGIGWGAGGIGTLSCMRLNQVAFEQGMLLTDCGRGEPFSPNLGLSRCASGKEYT